MKTPVYDPGDPPLCEPPCEVCGKDCDECICLPCPTCDDQGNPMCYEKHGMMMSVEQFRSRDAALAAQAFDYDVDFWNPDIPEGYLESVEYPDDIPDFR